MRIGFIGAGKAGCSLARYFAANGETVSGFFSRSDTPHEFERHATAEELMNVSDMVFITVPDGAIAEVWNGLSKSSAEGKLIYHISGAERSDVFAGAERENTASVHPMLAFSSKDTPYDTVRRAFFTIEGGARAAAAAEELLRRCGNGYAFINAEKKPLYHAANCFASNLVAAVCAEAERMLTQCGFTDTEAHRALSPLIEGNAVSICKKGVKAALTGPVSRGDAETVKKHLSVLSGRDREIYRTLSAVLSEISGHTELLPLLNKTDKTGE